MEILKQFNKGGGVNWGLGFSLRQNIVYQIVAKKVVCATGGASGIYKPNNPTFSRHKMWYSPFNTGAGYAMGIRSGAEMTSFEMRFIALRCKDTIAPTGTIAQGIRASQINSKGEEYVSKYGISTTHMRLYSTIMENLKGNGPCFLKTEGITISNQQALFIYKFLNILNFFKEELSYKEDNIRKILNSHRDFINNYSFNLDFQKMKQKRESFTNFLNSNKKK